MSSIDNSIEQANVLFINGEYLKSASILDKVIKIEESVTEPDSALLFNAYLSAGNTYNKAELHDSVINRYNVVFNNYEQFLSKRIGRNIAITLGDLCVKQGRYEEAVDYYRPDSNPFNNYSFPGKYNPNKGCTTSGSSSSYLRNYYNRFSGTNLYYYGIINP